MNHKLHPRTLAALGIPLVILLLSGCTSTAEGLTSGIHGPGIDWFHDLVLGLAQGALILIVVILNLFSHLVNGDINGSYHSVSFFYDLGFLVGFLAVYGSPVILVGGRRRRRPKKA